MNVIDTYNIKTMKKLAILSAIALSGLFVNTANAQIRVSLGFGFAPARLFTNALHRL